MAAIEAGLHGIRGERVALKGVKVDAQLVGGFTRVKLRQHYRNEESSPIEAVYTFPTPSDASLTGFVMECQGRRSEGVVQEREKAFRTYDDAVLSGHGAALLEQERSNIFTATVGNILPNESVTIEVEYVQRVQADEGSLRWMLPTLVAPRYIPGNPAHNVDRTAHGTATPTDRVPDADRISPPTGAVTYGLTLRLLVDLGREVFVESPSHALDVTTRDHHVVEVSFRRETVALDRDVVVTVRGVGSSVFSTVTTHRVDETAPGYFACTMVPDLMADPSVPPGVRQQTVVFLIDTSGSMEGDSIIQARSALRLCLRHLRRGDSFNMIAFSSRMTVFRDAPVEFTEETLDMADRWVAGLDASGGTELLAPLLAAVQSAPEGVVVLLTDGQIGNEEEVLRKTLDARKQTRVYSFGIGMNVSDALLRDLAQRTSGAVEFIHPGERIDDKVVAVFARAIAPRVRNVELVFDGVETSQVCPREVPELVDGEPWTILGRYESHGTGRLLLRGQLAGKSYEHAVQLTFPARVENLAVSQLWARARIQTLEDLEREAARRGTDTRRAEASRSRIVELSTEHQVVSKYTSFVIVEKRSGDRRAQSEDAIADTRVIPVNAPAGWVATRPQRELKPTLGYVGASTGGSFPMGGPVPMPAGGPAPSFGPPAPFAPAPMFGASHNAPAAPPPPPGAFAPPRPEAVAKDRALRSRGGPASPPEPEPAKQSKMDSRAVLFSSREATFDKLEAEDDARDGMDLHAVFARQLASGLWDDPHDSTVEVAVRQYRATARVLLQLLDANVDTNHAHFGTPLRKTLEAMLRDANVLRAQSPDLIALVLSLGLLVATGARTRSSLLQALQSDPAMASFAQLASDANALRVRVTAAVAAL